MSVKGFTFYKTYADIAEDLSPRSQGELYRAIVQYMFFDNDLEATLSRGVRAVYKACKPHLKTSKNRSENGVAGNNRRWEGEKVIANSSQTHRKSIASSSSSSISISRSNQSQTDGAVAVENPAPPVCPRCHRISAPNPETGKWECPECGRKLGWVKYA